jgi:hypothetical protein
MKKLQDNQKTQPEIPAAFFCQNSFNIEIIFLYTIDSVLDR